jgi:uncharacterized protein YkwD
VAAAVALVLVVAGSALAVRWHDGEGATGTAAATRHTSADASHTGEPATPPSPTPTATPSPPTTTPSATTRATAPRPSTATRTSKPSPSTKPPAAPTTKPPPPPPATTTPAREVLRLTNVERAKVGCVALRWNTKLASAAQAHSTDMRDHGYFSHTSLDGRTAFDRIKAAGYSYRQAAENIAAGQPTAAAVVKAWMGSSGHRANILNCGLKDLGVGYARGGSYGHYWTQDFGTP